MLTSSTSEFANPTWTNAVDPSVKSPESSINWSLNSEKLPHFEVTTYPDFLVFLAGLAKGLEGEVVTTGPCYQNLIATGTSADTIIAKVEKLAGGDLLVVSQLAEDIKAFLPQAQSIDGICLFKALFGVVEW